MSEETRSGEGGGQGLSREQIVWAYRVLFDLDPENEKAVVDAHSYGSMEGLRNAILASDEFRGRNSSPVVMTERPPSISPPLNIELAADETTSAALLARVAAAWEALGEKCPHWSVLSADQFSPERIATTEPEFYRSGATDVAGLMATLVRAGMDSGRFRTLFEFGCGVGRVTSHLAARFPRIEACDVSPSHIRLAEATIQAANIHNVTIVRAKMPHFGMTEPFDLWFSRIVLQHNPPPIIKLILERALNLLTPCGAAVFQVPTYARGYRFRVAEYLTSSGKVAGIEMHVLPQSEIFAIAQSAGCIPVEVMEDDSVGVPGWISSVFVFRKRAVGKGPD
jgi:SAM-dependent methyltransferase